MTPRLVRIGGRRCWLVDTDDAEKVAAFTAERRALNDQREVWTPADLHRLGIEPSAEGSEQ